MINNKELWEDYVNKNDDPYGKCCVDVAREVMNILDTDNTIISGSFAEQFNAHKIICDADRNINAGGITGFMAGAVASMVSQCHSRGKEFRDAWNALHGIKPDIRYSKDFEFEETMPEGTVNPAILAV